MYSVHNEGNSVVGGRFIRTLKKKIYKYTTSISKNVYIDKLDDIVNKYNTAYHSTTKMNSVDVKSNTCIDFSKEIHEQDLKFKISDIFRIQNYKNIFAKAYTPNSSEGFVNKKDKNTLPGKYVVNDLNDLWIH